MQPSFAQLLAAAFIGSVSGGILVLLLADTIQHYKRRVIKWKARRNG